MMIGDSPLSRLRRTSSRSLLRARPGCTPSGPEMLGGDIAIIITSCYFLLRGMDIVARTWRVASAKFEEKKPERQRVGNQTGKPANHPAAAAVRLSANCRLRR